MKKAILIPAIAIICAVGILLGLTFGLQKVAVAKAEAEHLKIMQTLLPISGTPGYYEIEYVTESGDVYTGEFLIE